MVDNITYVFTNITSPTNMEFTSTGVLYAVIFTVLVMLFILIPFIWELRNSYALAKDRDKRAQAIMESCIPDFISRLKAQNTQMTDEEIGKICDRIVVPVQETLKQPVVGITGFTRGMIAFAIIFLVGISVMLVMFADKGDPQIVNNIISMLGATLAAIAGFYFGGKTAVESKDSGGKNQTPAPVPAGNPPVAKPAALGPAAGDQDSISQGYKRPAVWIKIGELNNERIQIEERIHLRAKKHHDPHNQLTAEEEKKLQGYDEFTDSQRYVEIENEQWDLLGMHIKDNKSESKPS
jgi:hypothetical protein